MKKLSNQMRREIKRIIAFVLVVCMLPFSSFPTNAMSMKPVSEVVETVSNPAPETKVAEAEETDAETVDVQAEEVEAEAETESRLSRSDEYLDPAIRANSIGDKVVTSDWTLEGDTVVDELVVQDGNVDLNGYTLTVCKDLILEGGMIDVDNALAIWGDFRIQTRTWDEEAQEYVYGGSEGNLQMDFDWDETYYMLVAGDMYVDSIQDAPYLYAGILELKGDFYQIESSSNSISLGYHNNLVLSGDGQQIIQGNSNVMTLSNLYIENDSEEGIVFEGALCVNRSISMERNQKVAGNIMVSGYDFRFNKNYYGGNIEIGQDSSLTLSEDVEIDGNLIISNEIYIDANVIVNKDIIIKDSTKGWSEYACLVFYRDSSLTVLGDINASQTTNEWKLNDNSWGNAILHVNGDAILNNVDMHFSSTSRFEIEGDLDLRKSSKGTDMNGDTTLEFCGNKKQELLLGEREQRFYIINLEITNSHVDGVHIDNDDTWITKTNLNGNNLYLDGKKVTEPFALTEDTTIEDDCYFVGGTIDLNGYTLTCNGDLSLRNATLNLNGGTLDVKENLNLKYYGQLAMESEEDKVYVHGDFISEGGLSMLLKAGELTVHGNYIADSKAFKTSEKHITRIIRKNYTDEGKQKISFNNPEATNTFANLQLSINRDKYYETDAVIENLSENLTTYYFEEEKNEKVQNLRVVKVGRHNITIAFDKVTVPVGILGYEIWRDGQKIALIEGTQYEDTGLTVDTEYTYSVYAINTFGVPSKEPATIKVRAIEDTKEPERVENVATVTRSGSSITLSWDETTDNYVVAGYNVYRNNTKVAEGVKELSYKDTGLAKNTLYTYYVTAVDVNGNESEKSELHEEATVMPEIIEVTPEDYALVGGKYQSLSVKFDNHARCNRCFVKLEYYDSNDEKWVPLEEKIDSYVPDQNMPNQRMADYYWDLSTYQTEDDIKVRYIVYDEDGNEAVLEQTYRVDTLSPPIVTGFSVSLENANFLLSWDVINETDCSGYKLYRRIKGVTTFKEIAKIVGNTVFNYTDKSISGGATYEYVIRAYDQFGQESADSQIVEATAEKDEQAPVLMRMSPLDNTEFGNKLSIELAGTDNKKITSAKVVITNQANEVVATIEEDVLSEGKITLSWNPYNLPSGNYCAKAYLYDAAGNESNEMERIYRLDATGPDKVVLGDCQNNNFKAYLSWENVSANDLQGYKVQVLENNAYWVNVGDVQDKLYYLIENLKPDTEYSYRVCAYDAFENIGEPSEVYSFKTPADTQGPRITKLGPNNPKLGNVIYLMMEATDNAGLSHGIFSYSTDGIEYQEIKTIKNAQGNYSYGWDVSRLEEGEVTVRFEVFDVAGNKNQLDNGKDIEITYVLDHTPPSVPLNFECVNTNGATQLSWQVKETDTDIECYYVYRGISKDGTYRSLGRTDLTTYTDETVAEGEEYYYKVRAVDDAGNMGEYTEPILARIKADDEKPKIVSMSPLNGEICGKTAYLTAVIKDNAKLSNIIFEYKEKGSMEWNTIMEVPLASTESYIRKRWDASELKENVVYKIRAKAIDRAGNESEYVVRECQFDLTAPKSPVLTIAKTGNMLEINSTMNEEEDFGYYEVYRREYEETNFVCIGQSHESTYLDSRVVPGKLYLYRFVAVDKHGNTSESNVVSAYAEDEDVTPPTAILPDTISGVVGEPISFDGLSSVDNVRIVKYEWDFGDSSGSTFASPKHMYKVAGTYVVKLKVTDGKGNWDSAETKVIVNEKTNNTAYVSVLVTDINGKPLPNAKVYVQQMDKGFMAGVDGRVYFVTKSGSYDLNVYAEGYKTKYINIKLQKGENAVIQCNLYSSTPIVGNMSSRRMSLQEIEKAGIDLSDPDNYFTYESTINVYFEEKSHPDIYVMVTSERPYVDDEKEPAKNKYADIDLENKETGEVTKARLYQNSGTKAKTIVFPAEVQKISWLKNMYMVSLNVIHMSEEGEPIDDLQGILNLPEEGLTLVGQYSQAENGLQMVGSLDPGTSQHFEWYVRGDIPGDYLVGSEVSGVYRDSGSPFGDSYECTIKVEEQHTEGLILYIKPEARAYDGEEYYVQYRLENHSDETFYRLETKFGEPKTTNRVLKVRVIKDGKLYQTKTTTENVEYYVPTYSSLDGVPPLSSGDVLTVAEFKPGDSIVGTCVMDVPVGNESWYLNCIGALAEETENSNANISVAVEPISPHLSIIDMRITSERSGSVDTSSTVAANGPDYGDMLVEQAKNVMSAWDDSVNAMSNATTKSTESTEDPIDMMSGAYYTSHKLMGVSGVRKLDFDMFYDSTRTDNAGMLGYGWYHAYESRVVSGNGLVQYFVNPQVAISFVKESVKENTVTGTYEDGVITILPDAEEEMGYVPLLDLYKDYSLEKKEDGWVVTHPDGTCYEYNVEGKLIRTTNVQGQSIEISYGDNSYTIKDAATQKALAAQLDSEGRIVSVTDPMGNAVKFTYDEEGDLTSITDVCAGVLSYEYENHKIKRAWDPEKRLYLVNTYDEKGRVLTQDDGNENTPLVTLSYDEDESGNHLISVTGRNGGKQNIISTPQGKGLKYVDSVEGVKTYSYNEQGDMIASTFPNGRTESYEYDENGNLAKITDSATGVRTYSYNQKKQIVAYTDAAGSVGNCTYDENNRMISHESNGLKVSYTYNEHGQLLTSTTEGRGTITYSYDETGNKVLVEYPDGTNEKYEYNANGKVTAYVNRNGVRTEYTLDATGCVLSESVVLANGSKNTTSYTYDSNGMLLTKTDANGNTTKYEYDQEGNCIRETRPDGAVIGYTYNTEGQITSVRYPDGTTTMSAVYDTAGNLKEVVDTLSQTTKSEYNPAGQLTQTVQADGGVVTYEYYQNGLLKTQRNAENATITYAYDNAGRIIELTGPSGDKVKMGYGTAGKLTSFTDADGHTMYMSYNVYGDLVEETDFNGNKTRYAYDANGNCVQTTDALGNVTTYEFDALGHVLSVTQKGKNGQDITTSYAYDEMGNLICLTDAEGSAFKADYDKVGNILAIYDAYGVKTESYVYDKVYNPISVTDANGVAIQNTYDAFGNKIKTLNEANGSVATYSYVGGKLMSASEDALGGKTSAMYDSMGNLKNFTNPNGGVTSYIYDKNQNVTSEKVGEDYSITYTYDPRGNVKTMTNSRGQLTTYEYTNSGRIAKKTDEAGTILYTYDANGNVLTVNEVFADSNVSGNTITRRYDALNRVTEYEDSKGNVIKYVYDEYGNIVSMTYPDNKVVSYTYNKNGKVLTVTDWNDRVTSYTYNKNGQLSQTKKADGSVETITYDKTGRLQAIKCVAMDGTLISDYTYTYDLAGNVTSVNKSGQAPKTTQHDETVQMQYDDVNRLIKFNGEEVKYDADGNMIYGPVDGKMANLTYDCRNRLIEVKTDLGDITKYVYDAEDVRTGIIKHVGTSEEVSISYVTDSVSHELSRVLSAVAVYKNGTIEYNYYTYGDGLIAQQTTTGEKEEYLTYHYDNVGNTIALTDASGNVKETYKYSIFGKLLSENQTKTAFLYNGQYGVMNDDNGLYYMRARYYNVETMRFINQDILTGTIASSQSLNRYAYVEGNPVSFLDPFGLCPYKGRYDTDHKITEGVSKVFSDSASVFSVIGLALLFTVGPGFAVAAMAAAATASTAVATTAQVVDKHMYEEEAEMAETEEEREYFTQKANERKKEITKTLIMQGAGKFAKVSLDKFGGPAKEFGDEILSLFDVFGGKAVDAMFR